MAPSLTKSSRRAPLVVMKFGGTSVANQERIFTSSAKVVQVKKSGCGVVVVVSAPGDMTDDLISLARSIHPQPDSRELDMLMTTGEQVGIALFAIALNAQGIDAISLTGPQAGIMATDAFTEAKILNIRPARIRKFLKQGRVIVVAGFQGVNPDGEITTLGRGGSDLSAVALAAALGAHHCEIYTDVEGIYTADPSLAPDAKKIRVIPYDAMLELASAGAQVMQPRAIEVARRFNVAIHVKCSFNNEEGTWIMSNKKNPGAIEVAHISGIALDRNLAKLTVANVPDQPGVAARIFSELAHSGIIVDLIVQSAAKPEANNDISITVRRPQAKAAEKALQEAARAVNARRVELDESCAKISVIGTGLKNEPALAAKIFQTLADQKINIQMISNSDIKIAVIVGEQQGVTALRALHAAFGLGRSKT